MKTKNFVRLAVPIAATVALGLWWMNSDKRSDRSSALTTLLPNGERQALAGSMSGGRIQVCRQPEEQPAWCVPYGKEFWHSSGHGKNSSSETAGAPSASPLSVGDAIDRVSHALTVESADAAPGIRARTYSATVDGPRLIIGPYRPPDQQRAQNGSGVPAAQSADSAAAQRLAALSDRTPETPEEEDELIKRLVALAAETDAAGKPQSVSASSRAEPLQQVRHSTPRSGAEPESGVEATLQTISVRSGDRTFYAADSAGPGSEPVVVVGNTVQRRLGTAASLVEHIETRGQGVSLTWVLTKPLPNHGSDPLLLEAQLTGLTYAGATSGGLHFADGTGTARLRVGQVTVVDSAGRTWPVPLESEDSLLRVTVPATVLAEAEYPVAIDPLISPEFGLDLPVLVPAAAAQQAPAVAANGSSFLVAWEDYRDGDSAGAVIIGTRLTRSGGVSDPDGIRISPAGASSPTVAAHGSGYLVAWADGRNVDKSGIDIYGARVSGAGQVINSGGFPICAAPGDQLAPAATVNGTGAFVVWQDGRNGSTGPDIYGARVSSSGAVTDLNGFRVSPDSGVQVSPAVAFNGVNFLVVWSNQRETGDFVIYGARVTPKGAVLDKDGIPISTAGGGEFFPKVAAVGTNFLTVWEDHRHTESGGVVDVYGGRVTGAGVVLDRAGFPIGSSPGDRFAAAVAAYGADYLVAWQDARDLATSGLDILASRVSPAGVVTDATGFPVSTAPGDQVAPALASNGKTVLAVWTDTRNSDSSDLDIYGALIGPGTTITPANGILLSTGSSDEQRPAVASNGTNYLVVWQDYRNNVSHGVDLYGVRVSLAGSILDVNAIPISLAAADQMVPSVAASGEDYLVAWEDYRNADSQGADIYATRVTGAGVVRDAAGIPVSARDDAQLAPSVGGGAGGFLVTWQDERNQVNSGADIYGARVNLAGAVLDAGGISISSKAGAQFSSAVANNGTNFLVVWSDERNLGTSGVDVYASRVSPAGSVLDPDGLVVSTAPGDGLFPAVGSAAGSFLIVWQDQRNLGTTDDDIYGARLTGSGILKDPLGLAISTAPSFQAAPAVAANGTNYFVAWHDARNLDTSGIDIYGTAVRIDGTVDAPAGLTIDTRSADQQFAKLAAGSPGTILVVYQSVEEGAERAVGTIVHLADFPIITGVAVDAGKATLTWLSLPNRTYRVQYKATVTPGAWSDLAGDVLATGGTATKTDTTGLAAHRIYRVALLP